MTADADGNEREGLRRVAPKPEMAVPEPLLESPLPLEETTEFVTPGEKLFVLAHLGVPKIESSDWTCDIVGLVRHPQALRYDDLAQFGQKTVATIHQCAGNPLDPTRPARLIANVEWRGVLLRDILERADLEPSCQYIWLYGQDYGKFKVPSYAGPYQEHYVKDLPLDYVLSSDVIVATHLNGQALPAKHGFPARIVAPGFYGHNSVKWLCRVEAAGRRANGYFTKELYNDRGSDGTEKPVWRIEPESILVSPGDGSTLAGSPVSIWGWAWSKSEVESVQISTDGGRFWHAAKIDKRQNRSWQRFSYQWTPEQAGRYEVICRAVDQDGHTQPMEGARNAVHRVTVTVATG